MEGDTFVKEYVLDASELKAVHLVALANALITQHPDWETNVASKPIFTTPHAITQVCPSSPPRTPLHSLQIEALFVVACLYENPVSFSPTA